MSCSYAGFAMAKYDSLTDELNMKPKIWKILRDDILTLWEVGIGTIPSFLGYLNVMDTTGKIKSTMKITGENFFGFSDLKSKVAEGKIRVDVYAKSANVLAALHLTPATQKNICNIAKDIALRLRRIYNNDETFNKRYWISELPYG